MLPLKIAWRFVTHQKSQTVFIIIAFAIGIATNLFIGNLISAIEQDLIHRTIDAQPHIIISSSESEYLADPHAISEQVATHEQVTHESEILQGHAFYKNNQSDYPYDVFVRGYLDFEAGLAMSNLINDDYRGTYPSQAHHILVGVDFAEYHGIELNDHINVTVIPIAPIDRVLQVVGIFDSGNTHVDRSWIVGRHIMAAFVFYAVDRVQEIHVQVEDFNTAEIVAQELRDQLNRDDLIIEDWKQSNEALLHTITAQSISTKLVQGFILTAVIIAMGSLLNITVVNKQQQLGILKAMGLNETDVGFIFLFMGLILGIAGAVAGGLLGLGFISIFNVMAGENVVRIVILPVFSVFSVGLAISAALLISYLPYQRSRQVSVIDTIRRG